MPRSARTAPRPDVKVDARRERWREHRQKVRAEIVDAAFRAIDKRGPELSVREIAEEAGTAKPKIYRHFRDKADLFQAVSERLRDMLSAAIYPAIDLTTDSAEQVIRKGVEQYAGLVEEHPNVLRFLIQGRFSEQSASTLRALQEGREIMVAIAEMFSNELREIELDRDAVELAAFTTFGSVASATDWWLGSEADSPRRMSRDAFVDQLSATLSGTLISTAALFGIAVDPGQPIHMAARRPVAS